MSDVSWWERALGGAAPSPRAPAPATQPAGYPQKAVRWQPQYPPTGPRQEVEAPQPEGDSDDNWNRVRRQGYVDKAPTNTGRVGACPSCGGSNLFRRKGPLGIEAAPLCTDCGYNGDLFEQSGTLLNAIGMKSSGPVQFSRSDNPRGDAHFETDPGLTSSDFDWSNVR